MAARNGPPLSTLNESYLTRKNHSKQVTPVLPPADGAKDSRMVSKARSKHRHSDVHNYPPAEARNGLQHSNDRSVGICAPFSKTLKSVRIKLENKALSYIKQRRDTFMRTWSLVDTVYILVAVPLRVGFFFDPLLEKTATTWTFANKLFLVSDTLGCVIRMITWRSEIKLFLRKVHRLMSRFKLHPFSSELFDTTSSVSSEHLSGDVKDAFDSANKRHSFVSEFNPLQQSAFSETESPSQSLLMLPVTLADIVPWEVVLLPDLNLMHIMGLIRFIQAAYHLPRRFNRVMLSRSGTSALVRLLSFSTTAMLVYLIALGIYLAHVAASGYMLIAHIECGLNFNRCSNDPYPESWVLRDNLEKGSLWRKYFRSMYWGCKTVTTLGQGDLIPTTMIETNYRIFIQFLAGLWATAIGTACSFHFSYIDANMHINITTRLAQMMKFTSSRKISSELTADLHSYFRYMQRTRHGVEEELILSNLPEQYRMRCANFVKFKHLEKITLFKNRHGAFLRSVLAGLRWDCFVPNQSVLKYSEPEEMLIVSSGEIRVQDENMDDCGRLIAGSTYAEHALVQKSKSSHYLVADTFCEVWFLPRLAFKQTLHEHFPRVSYTTALQDKNAVPTSIEPERSGTLKGDKASAVRKASSQVPQKEPNAMRGRHGKMFKEFGSALSGVATWRLPNSKFQKYWRVAECVLMSYILLQVPYYIAFEREFGLLNNSMRAGRSAFVHYVMVSEFYWNFVVEIFFLLDLYFRSRCFVRSTHTPMKQNNNVLVHSIHDFTQSSSEAGLILESKRIYEHYLETENYLADVAANIPLPLIWDIIDKDRLPVNVVNFLRFLRMLRLIRVRHLKYRIRRLLLDAGISSALQFLINATIFCLAMTMLAGSLFYMASDKFSYHRDENVAVPSAYSCLGDASVYGNCSWYLYDQSIYNINSPFTRSYYWSIVLISTVGFGDIMSFSTEETIVGSIWIFMGAIVCYLMGSIISSALSQVTILEAVRRERLERQNLTLLTMTQVSSSTKAIVRQYYATKWKLNGSALSEDEMEEHFPPSLRKRVCASIYTEDLKHSHSFRSLACDSLYGMEGIVLQELAQVAKTQIFLRNVVIMRAEHMASAMFIVQTGEVELLANLRAVSSLPLASSMRYPVSGIRGYFQRKSDHNSTSNGHKRKAITPASTRFLTDPKSSPNGFRSNRHGLTSTRASFDQKADYARFSVPITFLKRGDCFGEESILSQRHLYQFSARAVSGVQITVIQRQDFLSLVQKYPSVFADVYFAINGYVAEEKEILKKVGQNLITYPKITKRCGMSRSDRTSFLASTSRTISLSYTVWIQTMLRHILGAFTSKIRPSVVGTNMVTSSSIIFDPKSKFVIYWNRVIAAIIVYNFYQIVFRLAFLPYPSSPTMLKLTIIDYSCDVCLYLDIYWKLKRFGFTEYGEKILDPVLIRQRYTKKGWFKIDCWSMLPIYYVGENFYFATLARLPRLLRSPQLSDLVNNVQTKIQEEYLHGSTMASSLFDLFKFFIIFLSTAHYFASLYYMLGVLQLKHGIADKSWVNVDWILLEYPDSISIHYLRAMYWCLSTFTVDCFGDIVARNFLETVFSIFICILGWIFIGQVIGRISTLIITLDKASKEQHERVESFEQYAKRRNLPSALRRHAMASLEYKSKCYLQLIPHEVFDLLPPSLHIQLFEELYGDFVRSLPEFEILTNAQIEAVASVLTLEIYLPGDVIVDATCARRNVYILKEGCGEIFAPRSRLIFATLSPGDMFGEFSFFLPNSVRLASLRAAHSSQVLVLNQNSWKRLWPPAQRMQLENKIASRLKRKYYGVALSYLNIMKNFASRAEGSTVSVSDDWFFDGGTGINLQALKSLTYCGSEVKQDKLNSIEQQNYVSVQLQTVDTPTSTKSIRTEIEPRSGRSIKTHSSAVDAFVKDGMGGSPSKREHQQNKSIRSHKVQQMPDTSKVAAAEVLGLVCSSKDLYDGSQSSVRDSTSFGRRTVQEPAPRVLKSTVAGIQQNLNVTRRLQALSAARNGRGMQIRVRFSSDIVVRWRRHLKRVWSLRFIDTLRHHITKELGNHHEGHHRFHHQSRCDFDSLQPGPKASLKRRHSLGDVQQARKQHLLSMEQIEVYVSRIVKQIENKWPCASEYASRRRIESYKSTIQRSLSTKGRASVVPASSARSQGRKQSLHMSRITQVAGLLGSSKDSGVNPFYIWAVPPTRSFVSFMNAPVFRHVWDVVMLIADYYCIFAIPFRACFLQDHLDKSRHQAQFLVWFAVECAVIDVVNVVNFILCRRYFTFLREGERVTDRAEITRNYYEHGSYVRDLIATIPLEVIPTCLHWLSYCAGRAPPFLDEHFWYCVSICRYTKLLRSLGLHQLHEKIKYYVLYERKVSSLSPTYFYLGQLMLDFVIGTHWIACLFYGTSYWSYYNHQSMASWLTSPGMLSFQGLRNLDELYEFPVWSKYSRSVHFSIGAITTVCYGDILPMNYFENIVTLFVIFLSIGVFSMLSGVYFKIFEMEVGRRAQFEQRVAQASHYMIFHEFPNQSWKQMQAYFSLLWHETKGMNEEEMLRGLTSSVKRRIALCVHGNLIRNVRLFESCEYSFAESIVTAMRNEIYVSNDVIIQHGDLGRSLYIIESGLVSVRIVRVSTVPAASREAQEAEKEGNIVIVTPELTAALAEDNDHQKATKQLEKSIRAAPNFYSIAKTLQDQARHSKAKAWVQGPTIDMVAQNQQREGSVEKPPEIAPSPIVPPTSTNASETSASKHVQVKTTEAQRVIGAFGYFGERSLIFGTPRTATCIALHTCSVFCLTLDSYEKILADYPHYRSKNMRDWVFNTRVIK
uniref:Voltagegated Ion Channel (VIC) Superfamily putative n=1 Tax=Albugo laibachii Nc14 TaxID=890382 RepID=F0WJX1_9STRA|nr:Voltagegated Ion Channel (VIC) Superfamily putative [Albugo laibachii Nc14]CCA24266.1 Voltagegated Ion Channel (VIC) Superfamily putative [Albugo laibachii Nc14]|eukprot:CCA24266.1 Voltagegated Ion Channel (VIC) Superfamily putative [Albugo laibachii Nc14]